MNEYIVERAAVNRRKEEARQYVWQQLRSIGVVWKITQNQGQLFVAKSYALKLIIQLKPGI